MMKLLSRRTNAALSDAYRAARGAPLLLLERALAFKSDEADLLPRADVHRHFLRMLATPGPHVEWTLTVFDASDVLRSVAVALDDLGENSNGQVGSRPFSDAIRRSSGAQTVRRAEQFLEKWAVDATFPRLSPQSRMPVELSGEILELAQRLLRSVLSLDPYLAEAVRAEWRCAAWAEGVFAQTAYNPDDTAMCVRLLSHFPELDSVLSQFDHMELGDIESSAKYGNKVEATAVGRLCLAAMWSGLAASPRPPFFGASLADEFFRALVDAQWIPVADVASSMIIDDWFLNQVTVPRLRDCRNEQRLRRIATIVDRTATLNEDGTGRRCPEEERWQHEQVALRVIGVVLGQSPGLRRRVAAAMDGQVRGDINEQLAVLVDAMMHPTWAPLMGGVVRSRLAANSGLPEDHRLVVRTVDAMRAGIYARVNVPLPAYVQQYFRVAGGDFAAGLLWPNPVHTAARPAHVGGRGRSIEASRPLISFGL
jgi:hypothetical protein